MVDVARNALRHLIDRRHVTLVVNPADLELVSDSVENLCAQLGGIEHLSVQADRRVGRGGAIARTEAGDIDAGLSDPAGPGEGDRDGRAVTGVRACSLSQLRRFGQPVPYRAGDRGSRPLQRRGRVSDLIGLIIEATGLQVEVGEVCMVGEGRDRPVVATEVVGFRGGRTLLMPLGDLHGIGPGTVVNPTGRPFRVAVGEPLLGRVIDGLGNPLDGMPTPDGVLTRSTTSAPPDAFKRPRITDRVGLGVRALDTLVPCGRGQRLGIFAGSGVGKSSLLGMIARSTTAQVNVIALVGERGREVREFIERDLGDALSHSVVVVATSDQPALVRIRAAFTATAIAEHFRDQGADVMLMMDSVTRFAMAQREVGLAIGEPPATRGYTPSVFALLPQLLERAGTSPPGSITGLYTVLVDGDDMNEPIADAVRSILDGHVVLTRSLAHTGHYPAIDVLQSVSRLIGEITTPRFATPARGCAQRSPPTGRRKT